LSPPVTETVRSATISTVHPHRVTDFSSGHQILYRQSAVSQQRQTDRALISARRSAQRRLAIVAEPPLRSGRGTVKMMVDWWAQATAFTTYFCRKPFTVRKLLIASSAASTFTISEQHLKSYRRELLSHCPLLWIVAPILYQRCLRHPAPRSGEIPIQTSIGDGGNRMYKQLVSHLSGVISICSPIRFSFATVAAAALLWPARPIKHECRYPPWRLAADVERSPFIESMSWSPTTHCCWFLRAGLVLSAAS